MPDETLNPALNHGTAGKSTMTRMLPVILLFSLVLHLWGLNFGLPQATHPDEPVVVTRAQYMAATGDMNPKAFHWPSLQTYLLAFEYKIFYLTGNIFGTFNYPDLEGIPLQDRIVAHTFRSPSVYYYTGRLTTVLFSLGLIWVFYIFARRFLKDPYAIIATLLLALDPIVHANGRYITPDIPAEFFFIAALYSIDRLYLSLRNSKTEKQSGRNAKLAVLSAVLIGLGTGTKYPVAALSVPLLAVILFTPSGFKIPWRVVTSIVSGAAIGIVFLVTTPFALLDFSTFLNDIRTIGHHVQEGHIGMQFEGGIWLTSVRAIIGNNGYVWITFAFIGTIIFFSNLGRTWPMLLAMIFVLIGIAPLTVFADRYLVPLIPVLYIGLVYFIEFIISKFESVSSGPIDRKNPAYKIAVAGCGVVLALSLISCGAGIFNKSIQLTMPNTRLLALDWIEKNIPSGSVIVKEQGAPDLNDAYWVPLVTEPSYQVTEITPQFARGGENKDPLDILAETRPEWVITSGNVRNRYMGESAKSQFPELVAVFGVYYDLIDIYLEEVVRFEPGPHTAGAEIVVYRVPDDFWDRVVLESMPVDDAVEPGDQG